MKLLVVLMLCAVAAKASQQQNEEPVMALEVPAETSLEDRNSVLINILVNQLIAYVRRVINNGSSIFGIPPLDPLHIDEYHLKVPAGLIDLDLKLKDIYASGVGSFVTHRSALNLRAMTFDIDISVPKIFIKAGSYDLYGSLFTAIPLFGEGDAEFVVEGFRFGGLLHLRQSDDGESVILDRIENPSFVIPSFKSKLTGAIGGGDIDAIVNAVIEEVIVDYVRRFESVIAFGAGHAIVAVGNPILDQLDTWKYIAPFV